MSLRPSGSFDWERLAQVLDHLLDSGECGDLLRVKGFVCSDGGGIAVNYTVSGRSMTRCGATRPMLNFIGRGVNRAQIKALLETAVQQ